MQSDSGAAIGPDVVYALLAEGTPRVGQRGAGVSASHQPAPANGRDGITLRGHPVFGDNYGWKKINEREFAYVTPLTYGRARINVGEAMWVRDGY